MPMKHDDILTARAHIEGGGKIARKAMLSIIDTYLAQHAVSLCMENTIHRLVKEGEKNDKILRH